MCLKKVNVGILYYYITMLDLYIPTLMFKVARTQHMLIIIIHMLGWRQWVNKTASCCHHREYFKMLLLFVFLQLCCRCFLIVGHKNWLFSLLPSYRIFSFNSTFFLLTLCFWSFLFCFVLKQYLFHYVFIYLFICSPTVIKITFLIPKCCLLMSDNLSKQQELSIRMQNCRIIFVT